MASKKQTRRPARLKGFEKFDRLGKINQQLTPAMAAKQAIREYRRAMASIALIPRRITPEELQEAS